MLAKFSVKKPYTVLVGIVLIVILGVVSVTRMTTDLLPDINLPYAIVMTTYVGASPEEVEEQVTKPIESSMATVSNVENVSSNSSENYSLVILEFSQNTNMDSVTLEMRENLDLLESSWGDSVGSPVIMKINPDMMPVMVAAVDLDDAERSEITDYVQQTLLAELESIEGVASVNTIGALEEKVQVLISQDKIDAVNEQISDALNKKFADAQKEITDAQNELTGNKKQVEAGQKELEEKQADTLSQLADGQLQIDLGKTELLRNEQDLKEAIAALPQQRESAVAEIEKQRKEALEELAAKEAGVLAQESELAVQKEELDAGRAELEAQLNALPEQEQALAEQEVQLAALQQMMETQILPLLRLADSGAQMDEQAKAQYEALLASLPEELRSTITNNPGNAASAAQEYMTSAQQALTEGKNTLAGGRAQLEESIAQMNSAAEQLEAGLAQITAGKEQLGAAKKQINDGFDDALVQAEEQIAAAEKQMNEAQQQIADGSVSLSKALAELNSNSLVASIEFSSAKNDLKSALSQIESGEQQIENSQKQLEESRKDAKEQADMTEKLTVSTVEQILTAQNFSMPAGYVTEDGVSYLVRVGKTADNIEDIKNLVLMDLHMDGIEPILLSDVADVVLSNNEDEIYGNINGNPGIALSMEKQTGYATGDVSKKLLEKFEELEKENDKLHLSVLMDQGVYIDMVVDAVLQNMILGGILAVLILFLFLKDLKPTFVVACSIPISVLSALVLMYFSGITLNVISMSGLALGIGMLVDNSIVVIENIYRMRSEGVPAKRAAMEGAKQVSGAIIASTLTTVCVFVPIVFTEGITRQLFVDMGLTIGYSLLASLVIALTLVPAMGAGLLKNAKEKRHPLFERLQNAYGKVLRVALNKKWIVLPLAIVLLVVGMWASLSKGTAFMPDMGSTQISVTVTTADDSTLEKTAEISDEIVSRISGIKDVETVGAMIGSGSSLSTGTADNVVTMYILLNEDTKRDTGEVAREIEKKTEDLDCEVSVQTSMMDMSALGGSGINVEIRGKDADTLRELAQKTASIVEKVEGTTEVSDGLEDSTPELRILVDQEKASKYNLTSAQIFQLVYARVAGSTSSMSLHTDVKDYAIYVENGEQADLTREELKKMTATYTDTDGKTKSVALSEFVTFEEADGFTTIQRDRQQRYVTVSAMIDEDHNVGLVGNDVEKELEKLEVPDGYTVEMAGEDQTINDAMEQLLLMLVLAIAFMYLIMVAQFQSLLSPFIVMFTLPLAFTGGFFALVISGQELSVIAMIGFIMLCGIIVNNGIVLVDYTNQLRMQGMSKKEALVQAGITRLRPVIMTALTTILGLAPMVFSRDMGADMSRPMAIVAIGGLVYGTVLTLVVVPCMYDLLHRKERFAQKERMEELED